MKTLSSTGYYLRIGSHEYGADFENVYGTFPLHSTSAALRAFSGSGGNVSISEKNGAYFHMWGAPNAEPQWPKLDHSIVSQIISRGPDGRRLFPGWHGAQGYYFDSQQRIRRVRFSPVWLLVNPELGNILANLHNSFDCRRHMASISSADKMPTEWKRYFFGQSWCQAFSVDPTTGDDSIGSLMPSIRDFNEAALVCGMNIAQPWHCGLTGNSLTPPDAESVDWVQWIAGKFYGYSVDGKEWILK